LTLQLERVPEGKSIHPLLEAQTNQIRLIALMLVKLNMSVNECLEQYQSLSKQIFRKERPLWRRIFGSDISKYSAAQLQTAVEGLLSRKGLSVELSLRCSPQENRMQGYFPSFIRHTQYKR
jgi:hypothetical protein